jgi:hypothetical protein
VRRTHARNSRLTTPGTALPLFDAPPWRRLRSTITRAEPLEEQLVDWIADFKPDEELRATILASIRSAANCVNDDGTRRRELVGQLERLRDLYVMGDLSKSEYVLRRQALEEELAQAAPPFDPRLDKAEELLADFGLVWKLEDDPSKRRRLISTLFDRVWQDGGTIVAVKPREAFLRYFQTADELARRREKKRGVKSGSDGTRTRDLRRDRPVMALPGWAGISANSRESHGGCPPLRPAPRW